MKKIKIFFLIIILFLTFSCSRFEILPPANDEINKDSSNGNVEWTQIFEDNFSDGVIDSEYIIIDPAPTQVIEANGYLQLNINTTDNGPSFGLDFNDLSSCSEVKVECKILYHEGSDPHSSSLITLRDRTYANILSSTVCSSVIHGWNGGNPQEGAWFDSEYSGSHHFNNITLTQRKDTWITVTVIFKFRSGIIEYSNNYSDNKSFNCLQTSSNEYSINIGPSGWFTGHYMRIDDLKIYTK